MEKRLVEICKYPLKYNYYVTDDGKVWSEKTNKFLSPCKDKDGYLKVRLISNDVQGRHRYSIHRLIMENFSPCLGMENLQVNHIDGDKENNSLINLEWVSCAENIKHAIDNDLRADVNGAAKLTKEQVLEIIPLILSKQLSYQAIGALYNVGEETIGRIKRKTSWKELTTDIYFD